jgi:hypothetical protein
MAAHVFEHFQDSPAMIQKAVDLIAPGGCLYLIVPDDSDLLSPDHFWFYTEATLQTVLKRVGLEDIRMASRRIVPQEDFIYAVARKPRNAVG